MDGEPDLDGAVVAGSPGVGETERQRERAQVNVMFARPIRLEPEGLATYRSGMQHNPEDTSSSEVEMSAWTLTARLQGIVCVICGKPPALHRRAEFYDTGLCRACAAEIEAGSTTARG